MNTTEFKGELKFNKKITVEQLGLVKSFLAEDCRDHPEWEPASKGINYINLSFLDDFSGIQWDGSEKTYAMEKLVNVIIINVQKKFPDFGLTGKLLAQGEEIDDRWELVIGKDGLAYRKNIHIEGTKIMCPHCEEYFHLECEK